MLFLWWVLILIGGVIVLGKENKLRNFWWKIFYKSLLLYFIFFGLFFVFVGVELLYKFCSGFNGVIVFMWWYLW